MTKKCKCSAYDECVCGAWHRKPLAKRHRITLAAIVAQYELRPESLSKYELELREALRAVLRREG